MEDFRIAYDPRAATPFDEQVVASVKAFAPYKDNFVDFLLFAANYMNEAEAYDHLFGFLEQIVP